jgi:hypothetical protein
MKRCNIDCEFLSEFDIFAKEPELYFKGKSQRTSVFGKILTYFYSFVYAGFFIYKIVRMLQKVDISFYETYAFSGIPSIKLNNHLFYGGFSLGGMIEETIYYPIVYYYEGHKVEGKMIWDEKILEIERCQLEKFGKEYQDIFKDKDLNNRYCLKNVDEITLEGYSYLDSYKYLYVAFLPCIGYTPDGRQCQDISVLEQFFLKNVVNFNIEDIELTPHIYDHPSQPLQKDINGPVFKTLYQQIYTYLQIVILETDKDVVGFEGLSDIETKRFLKYDESWIIAAPSPHAGGFQFGLPVCDVTIQLSSKVLTQKRKNTKLIEVLGDVGGLMEVVWSIFSVIATCITDILYDKALVNNLFSFDLDKKIVSIKNKTRINEESNISESPQIPSQNIPTTKIQIYGTGSFKDDSTMRTTKKLQEISKKKVNNEMKPITKKKKKKKMKLKEPFGSVQSMKSLKNEVNSQNIEEDELKCPNEISSKDKKQDNKYTIDSEMISSGNKSTERSRNEKRKIIDRIKMKCCCVYFWFCFSRKKKNIENALMDEGMKIIEEKLDIINIFKKMHSAEIIEKTLKYSGHLVEMSDECKRKIHALYKLA